MNCASIPESLIESEFFGHEKGAFTGALTKREGRFELAHGGTLLLDEISEISTSVQVKLLRVLQEREFERVGGSRTIKVDVRVIATTNRRLEESVERKEFRQDLFFRLNVVPIILEPLREHKEDIPLLVNHFLCKFARKHGIPNPSISEACREALQYHNWPGNIREVQNVVERALILCDGGALEPAHLGITMKQRPVAVEPRPANYLPPAVSIPSSPVAVSPPYMLPLGEVEKQHILAALDHCHGNRTHACKLLAISVRTMRNKLNAYKADGHPGLSEDPTENEEVPEEMSP